MPSSKICDCLDDCIDGSDESSSICSYKTCEVFSPVQTRAISKVLYGSLGVCNVIHSVFGITDALVPDTDMQAHHVCDQKHDCLYGADELLFDCKNLLIENAFFCPQEGIYVSFYYVNDFKVHCKQSFEDELVQYVNVNLPWFCESKGLSVIC